ncbi:MAG: CRTAC1 family protein, partial [Cyclobacteriaceae bacterium]|nr:CRTAC1 family protein [Cyclobacteriaceae bacterium]
MKFLPVITLMICCVVAKVTAQPAAFIELTSAEKDYFNAREARGVSVADYDNDGDDDIFISANPCKLYRNDGDFVFTEVSIASGISAAGKLALWFDANDDGWLDLLVSGYNQLKFYRNNHNGTFTEDPVTGFTGTTAQVALVAGDLNGDGWLDVYANNFKIDNQFFINYGNDQFRNRIAGSGAEVNDQSMGSVLYDFDLDGDLDMYITFDGYRPNKLFINDGEGHFVDRAPQHNLNIRTQGMGVDLADFNRDGAFDLYVTNLFDNSLLMNDGSNYFSDQAKAAGVNDYGMGWGVTCFDYNNDGLTDIYINNEFNFSPYPNRLYRNNGNGSFTDVAVGTALENRKSGFGSATADFNNDGLPDLVVVNNSDLSIRIFRNAESNANRWMALNLVGTTSNKFAAGAHVFVYANGTVYRDVVKAGSGWYSQNSYRMHIGLGANQRIDSLVIRWPDGLREVYHDLITNQRYLAVQHETLNVFEIQRYHQALTRPTVLIPSENLPDPPLVVEPEFSIARIWNEALLEAIRNDFARPTVHARNLYHISAAMYDAWAAYETGRPTYFLGKQRHNIHFPLTDFPSPLNIELARKEAISYAAYRLISYRFRNSPGASITLGMLSKLMLTLGYNADLQSLDYATGEPYALGNYIASLVIAYGKQDGSNEENDYANLFYKPVNPPINPAVPGNPRMLDPNRWQPLNLVRFIDQSGNEIGEVPPFLSPEWGRVQPFSLEDRNLSIKKRDGHEYWVYYDPGKPPLLDTQKSTPLSEEYKKSFLLVSIWSSPDTGSATPSPPTAARISRGTRRRR